jgi:hypothetical protein
MRINVRQVFGRSEGADRVILRPVGANRHLRLVRLEGIQIAHIVEPGSSAGGSTCSSPAPELAHDYPRLLALMIDGFSRA